MAKKQREETPEQDAPLQPSKVETIPAPPRVETDPELPRGHVLLAVLDKDGNEGTIFHVHERGWKSHYSDETKFRLKKKAIKR